MRWLALMRPGDYLTVVLGLTVIAALAPLLWNQGRPDKAIIRVNGQVISEVDLSVRKTIEVRGPLGPTIIAIDQGRARVLSDPSPRQYCVLQGWLTRAGDVAICAPNRINLQITGRKSAYDSLAY